MEYRELFSLLSRPGRDRTKLVIQMAKTKLKGTWNCDLANVISAGAGDQSMI